MTSKEKEFVRTVWDFYHTHGRHTLPWRQTADPYRIAVSEIMLQQTQVDRVLPKYEAFVRKWGSTRALARASLGEVLIVWQGLGYNRRARLLHQCAQTVVKAHSGQFPASYKGLLELPGIGPYTAGAISSFAYNQPVPILETNIKTVYLHHFYPNETEVSDDQLLKIVTKTLDHKNPREWYWALMDYGSYIKKTIGNNVSQSASYKKQSIFKNSDRQIRGAIIRELATTTLTRTMLIKKLSQFEDIRIDAQLDRLLSEKLVVKRARSFSLPH